MQGSYIKINYALRPAKCIERKMLCESFVKLSPFGQVEKYRYVGFGSTYFSDFILFHKSLNICNMISIEKDTHNKKRFEFNRPFNCIDIRFGDSVDILPELNWDIRTIIWLDYDGRISADVLSDLTFVLSSCCSGTIILVSINVEPEKSENPDEKIGEYRRKMLEEAVGKEHIPIGLSDNDLNKKNFSKTCRNILNNHISHTLTYRNGVAEIGNRMLYRQLYNFSYSDGAKMLTVGGIVFDEGQENLYAQCSFDSLSFIRNSDDAYDIQVPNLTYKEIRELNSQLPGLEVQNLSLPNVPQKDLTNFKKLYRYFPTFSESSA
ncbi:O-methyltransferase [Desulfolutivibrio sp.]|uniref:O-methyltransferase n=1 Tax=Desulfolutivibrio sp. TaxID=2773296 RepID=UPI002F963BA1